MTDEPPVEQPSSAEKPAAGAAKKAPAKKAAAKKAPATKAAAKKAPAKKAPAKKAPAKKAPAKKAPAKKAPAKKMAAGTPRASILNRIHELEERIAADMPAAPRSRRADAPAPVVAPELGPELAAELAAPPQAPLQPLPTEQPEPPAAAAEPEPEPVVVPTKRAAKAAKASRPPAAAKPVAPVVIEPEAAEPAAVVPETERTRVVPVASPSPGVRGARVLAGLVVLLLALATGMFVAAFAKDRPATWRSEAVVTLSPPAQTGPDTEGVITARVAKKVEGSGFAGLTAAVAGVPATELQALVDTRPAGAGQVAVVVRADHAESAVKLADAAGRQYLLTLASDQAVLEPGRRLGGEVSTAATRPVKEKPSEGGIWLAGVLAGLTVLVLGTVVVVLMTTSKPPQRA